MSQRAHSASAASLATLLAHLSLLPFYRRCESAGEHYSDVAARLCHLERRERIVVTPRARCGKSLYPGLEGCVCI